MVEQAVSSEPVSGANSLLSGKIQGILANYARIGPSHAGQCPDLLALSSRFPYVAEQGNFPLKQGFCRCEQGICFPLSASGDSFDLTACMRRPVPARLIGRRGIVTLIERHEQGAKIGIPYAGTATCRQDTIAAIRNSLWYLREIR